MSEPSLVRAYATPLLLTLLSVGGLALSLVYDGVIDVVAVSLVIVPIVVLVRVLVVARALGKTSPPVTRLP